MNSFFNELFEAVKNSHRFSTVSEDNGTIIAVCDEYGIEFNIKDGCVTFYVYGRYVNVDMWDYIKDTMEWLEKTVLPVGREFTFGGCDYIVVENYGGSVWLSIKGKSGYEKKTECYPIEFVFKTMKEEE